MGKARYISCQPANSLNVNVHAAESQLCRGNEITDGLVMQSAVGNHPWLLFADSTPIDFDLRWCTEKSKESYKLLHPLEHIIYYGVDPSIPPVTHLGTAKDSMQCNLMSRSSTSWTLSYMHEVSKLGKKGKER